jgi:yeast amino acid transporter
MGITYVYFDRALKAQGHRDNDFLPVKARWPLASAWYVIIVVGFTCIFQAYTIMSPTTFDGLSFFFDYAAIFIFVAIFTGWKLVKRTKFVKPHEADLVTDLASLDVYTGECEAELADASRSKLDRFLDVSTITAGGKIHS